jgi:hypothetical protein
MRIRSGVMYVNWSCDPSGLRWPPTETTRSTVSSTPVAGSVAVHVVELEQMTFVASLPLNDTCVQPGAVLGGGDGVTLS